jgi:uncharacterized protein YbjT (DUF2867 family)
VQSNRAAVRTTHLQFSLLFFSSQTIIEKWRLVQESSRPFRRIVEARHQLGKQFGLRASILFWKLSHIPGIETGKPQFMEVSMYVVIGASGHTGSEVASALLAQGKKVRVLGRNAGHLTPLVAKGAEPFAGNVTDGASMVKALAGAQAAYLMIPPDVAVADVMAYQKHIAEVFGDALEKNEVKHAVTLSSIGADKPAKTGPIQGLHYLEERLNRIAGLNVLHLRAAYFMENTLGQAEAIKQMGYAAGPLRPELKFPCIASRDIGAAAGEALLRLDFAGKQVRELHGQRDISYAEITSIIGKAIGKPDLNYVTLTGEQFRTALVTKLGMSENAGALMTEMTESMNSGYIRALEARSPRSTTPTSYETFVSEEFLPRYKNKAAA